MLKLETMIANFGGEWATTKSTVLDQSAALSARLDRIEEKLDQVLAELRKR